MKKLLLIVIFIFVELNIYAQTDGISYQAVIIDPNGIELPGVDSDGNILPNTKISIRFTILDATNSEEYQEVQNTETDLFGRVNLIIGTQNPDNFASLEWDGSAKDLKVEIDFKGSGSNFVDMSREQLTFVPYSYHRNILARGTLIVDDTTDLNGELVVQGPTNLNSTLNVNNNNDTNLSGQLKVEGKTILKNSFEVDGLTVLNDSLNVKAKSSFSGNMQVTADAVFEGKMEFQSDEPANFNSMVVKDSLNVDGSSNFNGQMSINLNGSTLEKSSDSKNKNNTTVKGYDQEVFNHYAFQIQGHPQGIAIKVNQERSSHNNYISFWDTNNDRGFGGEMWGRIEGISDAELEDSWDYKKERLLKTWDIVTATYSAGKSVTDAIIAGAELVASGTSSTACLGVGACVTAPIPSLIVVAIFNQVLAIADGVLSLLNLGKAVKERATYHNNKFANIGVTYASGAGDYAEWLPKENNSQVFMEGELVGVKNGMVTKNTWDVEKIMVVSTRPIVLGNMPQPNNEKNSVKIAFMGQVPVSVIGKVEPGDFILPDVLGNGFARAVNPENMKTNDYKKVAGVAWSIIEKINDKLFIVNVAVGINNNDMNKVVSRQQDELKALELVYEKLKQEMEFSNSILKKLVPGYGEALETGKGIDTTISKNHKNSINKGFAESQIAYSREDDIIYFEITKEQIGVAIEIAREQYQVAIEESKVLSKLSLNNNKVIDEANLLPIEDHPFWQKIDSDPSYKNEIIDYIQLNMEKSIHTHKKHAHKFTDLKVKE